MFHSTLLLCLLVAQGRGPREDHLNAAERARIDQAIARGRSWLLDQQREDGAFSESPGGPERGVALTAMALWALASSGDEPRESLEAAARALLVWRQEDGGVYDPGQGLAVYTSGVALRALRTATLPDTSSQEALARLELFVYRSRIPESLADAQRDADRRPGCAEEARALLEARADDFSAAEGRALDFLSRRDEGDSRSIPFRARQPGWKELGADSGPFSYEDVLPFVYLQLEAGHPSLLRALAALSRTYQVERNPDLTARYGPEGFLPGTQGLYYYYHLVAKALSTHGLPWIDLEDGSRHDWVRELSQKILALQRPPGYWTNEDPHWWEDEPVLSTSYAILSLDLCKRVKGR